MGSNVEKTLKNSLISVVAQILSILLSFANRRIFILFLDIEYLGYQTLFSNVFLLLSVAELGIGNIISFHLYKEVAERNEEEIGKLMHLYKWLYRIVAAVVFIAGFACCFLLPFIVKDAKAGREYLYLVYFLQLSGIIAGYFLSYRRTIYIATQQEYKCITIDLYVSVIAQLVQIGVLALFRNYLLYLCVNLSASFAANMVIGYKTNREFPFLKQKYKVKRADIERRNMFSDVKNFLVHKISYAIYGGTDNIIISAFCGIRSVALYGNYMLVQSGVMQVLFYKLLNPVQATLGNIIYGGRKKEDLWSQFQVLDMFSFFFASYIGLGFWIFFQPFIQLWMGCEYLLSTVFVMLLSITIYLGAVWEIVYKYRTVFGDYRQDRNCMVLSAALNILISIPGAKYFGIEGIQFGTLAAYLPIAFGRIRFVVKSYFGKSMVRYLCKHGVLLGVVLVEGLLAYAITVRMPVNIFGMIERGISWLVMPCFSAGLFLKNPYFKMMLAYFNEGWKITMSKLEKK